MCIALLREHYESTRFLPPDNNNIVHWGSSNTLLQPLKLMNACESNYIHGSLLITACSQYKWLNFVQSPLISF